MLEKVTNIKEYISALENIRPERESNLFYRGQSKKVDQLRPSVFRENLESHENEIYIKILTDCSQEFERDLTHIDILSKMQHYGVPTRLLDVTTNALVALFFACKTNQNLNNDSEDGIVYIFEVDDKNVKNFDSDTVSILSSLPRFSIKEKEKIRDLALKYKSDEKDNYIKCGNVSDDSSGVPMFFNNCKNNFAKYKTNKRIQAFNRSDTVIKRLLHEIKKEKPAFENIINPIDLLNNYIVIPQKTNPRILRQNGAFILFGLETKLDSDFKTNKIIVDKNSKSDIIYQLETLGISEATLFPELYKAAEYIKGKISSNS